MLDWLTGTAQGRAMDSLLQAHQAQVDTLTREHEDTLQALERAVTFREDRGWAPYGVDSTTDAPAHEKLVEQANMVRAFSTTHPLIVRARQTRAAFTFGEGVQITCRDDEGAHGDIVDVVESYTGDAGNAAVFFGHTGSRDRENDLFDDGNVFLGHWVNARTGDVRVRPVPFTEVVEIRTAPGDYATNHLYRRTWHANGQTHQAWYPDLDYDPATKPRNIDGVPVLWPGTNHPTLGNGAAIYQVRVNVAGRTGVYGVGDGWPGIVWARRHADFLADTAHLYASLAKIAHVVSGQSKAQTGRATAQAMAGPAGGALYGDPETKVSTPSFVGIDPKMGRPYAAMVAAGVGLPVTVLTADPGQEGARAVAETLDRPMRLEFMDRQRVWADAYRASILFKLRVCAEAPGHPLKARVVQTGDRKTLDWGGKPGPIIDVIFPDITEGNQQALVDAVVKAAGTGTLPNETTLRLLLQALEVEDLEEVMDRATDDSGAWVDPNQGPADRAGLAAMRAARDGADL